MTFTGALGSEVALVGGDSRWRRTSSLARLRQLVLASAYSILVPGSLVAYADAAGFWPSDPILVHGPRDTSLEVADTYLVISPLIIARSRC